MFISINTFWIGTKVPLKTDIHFKVSDLRVYTPGVKQWSKSTTPLK